MSSLGTLQEGSDAGQVVLARHVERRDADRVACVQRRARLNEQPRRVERAVFARQVERRVAHPVNIGDVRARLDEGAHRGGVLWCRLCEQ